MGWLLHRLAVTAPIVGATKLHHLDDAIAAVDLSLSEAELARLKEPYVPHPVAGHGWSTRRSREPHGPVIAVD